jgi:hypothetical protein
LIFSENGFDIEVVAIKRIEKYASRWEKSYKRNGIIGSLTSGASEFLTNTRYYRTFFGLSIKWMYCNIA